MDMNLIGITVPDQSEPGVMAMNGYITLPRSPELEPHH